MRDDLKKILLHASQLGYRTIRLRTNGVKLSDLDYLNLLLEAGVNEFEISFKGHNGRKHDELSGVSGVHAFLARAVQNIVRKEISLEATLLITAMNYRYLQDAVQNISDMGIKTCTFFFVSLFGIHKEKNKRFLPKLSKIASYVLEAFQFAEERHLTLRCTHIPPCFFPEAYRKNILNMKDFDLLIISPTGKFKVEDSPYEGTVKTEVCLACEQSINCNGLRKDYVDVHGTKEIKAIL